MDYEEDLVALASCIILTENKTSPSYHIAETIVKSLSPYTCDKIREALMNMLETVLEEQMTFLKKRVKKLDICIKKSNNLRFRAVHNRECLKLRKKYANYLRLWRLVNPEE